jgi:predicted phosphate transport protein (TIGR00153 family)
VLKNHQKELIDSINVFLDNILNINKLFKELLKNYFNQEFDKVETITNEISKLESQCDKLRRQVERKIYQETLIPDLRGDVLGMLENIDKIPGQIQANAHSFNTEKPNIPKELNENFLNLYNDASECISLLVDGARNFFINKKITLEKCLLVSKIESKADVISTALKKNIFSDSKNGLATKVHLRYFVDIMDEVANLSEDVADRLIISSSKN